VVPVFASFSAYEMLRESGVIKLQSQRTLRDYTYFTNATLWFSDDVDRQLMDAAKLDTCAGFDRVSFRGGRGGAFAPP